MRRALGQTQPFGQFRGGQRLIGHRFEYIEPAQQRLRAAPEEAVSVALSLSGWLAVDVMISIS
jgi:hypothetical protein